MCFLRSGTSPNYTYKPIAGQTNCTLSRDPNYRETSNKNLGGYKDFFQGIKSWTASVDVDIPDQADTNANEVNFEDLQDLEDAGTKSTYAFAWVEITNNEPVVDTTKRMYSGLGLVSCPLNAPSGENATTTVTIQGCRALTATDPT